MILVWVLQTVKTAVWSELRTGVIGAGATIAQSTDNALCRTAELSDSLPVLAVEAYPVIADFRNVDVIKIHPSPTRCPFR